MPFTLAHPGYSLIFKRKNSQLFDSIALTVGSIVPDFDIIFRLTNTRQHIFSYSAIEVIFIILPIAVLLTIYGDWIRNRLEHKTIQIIPIKVLKIVSSCLIGIGVHLLLDRYSHFDAAQLVIAYDHESDHTFEFYNNLYYFLQYGPTLILSIVGFILIAVYIKINGNPLTNYLKMYHGDKGKILLLASALFIMFFSFKIFISGLEPSFYFDSAVITFTGSFVAVCFCLPLFLLGFPRYFKK